MPRQPRNPGPVSPAPANPLAVDPLPRGWPKFGKLRGKKVDLMIAKRTLPPSELAQIAVKVPGEGVIYPWRGSDYFVGPDGEIFL